MKRLFFLIGILLPCLPCLPQSGRIAPLNIGDQVPTVPLLHTVNLSSNQTSLNFYRGKLLLLDFWTTNCSSCIAGLAKLDSLQKQFNNQIQIVSVTSERNAVVRKFYANGKIHRPPLATITDDSLLHAYFPHASIPHVVWIDPAGKVLSFTYAEYVTTENIRMALAGKMDHLSVKNDIAKQDYSLPMMKPIINLRSQEPIFYSVLTGYSPGLVMKSGIELDSSQQVMRRYATNWSAVELYLMALKKLINFPRNQIRFDLPNPEKYLYTPDQGYFFDWQLRHAHCYEIRCPPNTTKAQLQSFMLNDLNRYLHLKGGIQLLPVQCLILKRDSSLIRLSSTGGPSEVKTNANGDLLFIQNTTISALLYQLNNMQGIPPIIDSTGISNRIDLSLNIPYGNRTALEAALSRYGLILTEEQRTMEILVITKAPDL
ncbi:TlpA disulfide reductase family protein [Chitinophaga sp.]|uniref:TlpA family protein disulfide reductase n=1 Tax=Chitinophaga sp. TaxID=1869181 RepID=UPI002F94345C